MRTSMAGLAVLTLSLWIAPSAQAQSIDPLIEAERQINNASQQSQKKIEKISDETQTMLDEFRATNQKIDTLRVYNRQLDELIADQVSEIDNLTGQIDEVSVIERQIMPLMEEMVGALEQFVKLDVPFFPEERSDRIKGLRELMTRSDVSVAERYRKIMEAWQIENDYGRAVDTYRATLDTDGKSRTVDFLKIGRVAFLYLTPDDREAGVWDQQTGQWTDANAFRGSIRKALKMANKQIAVDLVTLPVPAPTNAAGGTAPQASIEGLAQGVGE